MQWAPEFPFMGFSRRCQSATAVFTTLYLAPTGGARPHFPSPRHRRCAIVAAAMLRLRSCIVSSFLSSPPTTLHRLLSAAAPAAAVPPNPSFAVDEYLVATCGLTPAQALKASTKLSHLKSPAKPDAVLAFLAGLGLSTADVAAVVAKDPKFLCANMEETLASNAARLTGLGLSRSEVARLVPLAPDCFRSRSIVPKLQYYLPLFGSSEKLLRALNHSSNLLTSSLEKVVKPNVAFLQECGIDACDIAWLCLSVRWILHSKPERIRAMVARAEALGVPRGSGMFKIALHAVASLDEEKITAKVDYLKHMFRWSDDQVRLAVSKAPSLMRRSNDTLQRVSEFLISEVGLEPEYIARLPGMITFSLEGRLRPRYHVLKFLKENGLDHNWGYYTIFKVTEKLFVEKLIYPHKKSAPHLAEDYAAACRGEVPISFRFTSTKNEL